MKKTLKLLLPLAALVLLIGGSYVVYQRLAPDSAVLGDLAAGETVPAAATSSEEAVPASENESSDSSTEPEKPAYLMAADFTVYDRESQAVRLSDFFGKPIVVNFWASWCPPCKGEMPEFDEVWQELGEEITFLMVNATDGSRETLDTAADYIDSQGYSFPVYYDLDGEASYLYGISSLPTTLFFDCNGYFVTGAMGQISEDVLRLGISYAIEQGPMTDDLENPQ